MKKKSLAIGYLLILSQISILGISILNGSFLSERVPVFIAILILIIGVVGGWWIKNVSEEEPKKRDLVGYAIIIIGSTIVTIGSYVTLVPGWFIITHSSTSAILCFIGFILPVLMYKY